MDKKDAVYIWFTLEQHQFELCGPTYIQFFLITTVLHDPGLVESTDA